MRLAELMLRPLATLQFSFTSDSTVVKDHKMEGAALVGLTGVEPVTSSLSGTRSNQLSYKPGWSGGGSRSRTGDLLLAKQPLHQLSYAPAGQERRGPGGGEAERTSGEMGRPGGRLQLRTPSRAPCSSERR